MFSPFIYLFIYFKYLYEFYLFIYLFMTVLGLCPCARAFPSRGKRGPLFITVRGPPTIAASPVAEHRLQTRRLSNCGSRAQPPRGTWDPPRRGLEPASPALAGRLPTTAPPGKPLPFYFEGQFCWLLSLYLTVFFFQHFECIISLSPLFLFFFSVFLSFFI